MNELRTTTYPERAAATRKRRSYPSKAQILAGRKLIREGIKALTKAELELLATHKDFGTRQREEFAALAASNNWT